MMSSSEMHVEVIRLVADFLMEEDYADAHMFSGNFWEQGSFALTCTAAYDVLETQLEDVREELQFWEGMAMKSEDFDAAPPNAPSGRRGVEVPSSDDDDEDRDY